MKKAKRYTWKQLLFDIHLWLGLASGVIVCILCFTGFYLALQPAVEEWLNRDLYVRSGEAPEMPVSELLQSVTGEGKPAYSAIQIPTDSTRPWTLRVGRRSSLVDPGTGVVLGEPEPFLDGSYRFCFRLHRWLLLESSLGRPITGAATVIFLILTVTGVILWIQKTAKNRRRGLLLRRGVSFKRLNYDTHLVLGLYASVPLFVMGLTGLFWSYRTPFVATAYRLLDGSPPPIRERRDRSGEKSGFNYELPYEAVTQYFQENFPQAGELTIYFPREGEAAFRAVKSREAGLGALPVRDEASFQVGSGEVIEQNLYENKSRAQRLLSLVKAIHVGEFNGVFSMILYLVCTLIGTTLPLSGTIMWWNRIKWRFFNLKAKTTVPARSSPQDELGFSERAP